VNETKEQSEMSATIENSENVGDHFNKPDLKRCKSLTWDACTWHKDFLPPVEFVEGELNDGITRSIEVDGDLVSGGELEGVSSNLLDFLTTPTPRASEKEQTRKLLRRATFANFKLPSPASSGWNGFRHIDEEVDNKDEDIAHDEVVKDESRRRLRRINSAALVKKAFPEMLFDRTSCEDPENSAYDDDELPPAPALARREVRFRTSSTESCLSSDTGSLPTEVSSPQSTYFTCSPSPSPVVDGFTTPPTGFAPTTSFAGFEAEPIFQQHHQGAQPMPAMMDMQHQMQMMFHMQQMFFAQQAAAVAANMTMIGAVAPHQPEFVYGGLSPPMAMPVHPLSPNPVSQRDHHQPWESPSQEGGARKHQHASKGRNTKCSTILSQYKREGVRPSPEHLKGIVLEFAKDAHGSRYLQEIISQLKPLQQKQIIDELIEDTLDVMQDVFGNYVIQVFLKFANDEQLEGIVERMEESVVVLSMNQQGCRVVQRLLETVNPTLRMRIMEELVVAEGMLETCAIDPHASHVLQKAVLILHHDALPEMSECARRRAKKAQMHKSRTSTNDNSGELPTGVERSKDKSMIKRERELIGLIETMVLEQGVINFAVNQNACRLVQRVLGDCKRDRNSCIASMMDALEKNFGKLAVDQHGNFILQHIVLHGQADQARRVTEYVNDQLIKLSHHKFGSHLVEQCLVMSTGTQRSEMMAKLTSVPPSQLTKLMKDPYANFVLQRAYDIGSKDVKALLAQEAEDRAGTLSQFSHGRHLLSHLTKKKFTSRK